MMRIDAALTALAAAIWKCLYQNFTKCSSTIYSASSSVSDSHSANKSRQHSRHACVILSISILHTLLSGTTTCNQRIVQILSLDGSLPSEHNYSADYYREKSLTASVPNGMQNYWDE